MQLYILRHGDAERLSSSDRERQLTARGKVEVQTVLTKHKAELAAVETIWVSPYMRAQQTAAVVSEQLPNIAVQTLAQLTPDNRPVDVLKFLCQQPEDSTLLLVSHQPLVSDLVANLCDVPFMTVGMHTAALASILLNPVASGMGQLQYID